MRRLLPQNTSLLFVGFVGCGGSIASGQDSFDAGATVGVAPDSATPAVDNLGSISAKLELPAGVSVSSAGYEVTGPNGYRDSDMLSFVASQGLSFYIGSVPEGTGYTINVTSGSASSPDACLASSSLNVVAHKTTSVNLVGRCSGALSGPSTPPGAPSSSAPPPPQVVEFGSVAVGVIVPSGDLLPSLAVHLVEPGGVDFNDSVAVSPSLPIKFVIQNVPAGTGEDLTLKGTTVDGRDCVGMSTFDVIGHQMTEAIVDMQCAPLDGAVDASVARDE